MQRGLLVMFPGMPVISSPFCVTRKYFFPESKNRSRRLHKKLVKKFGTQWTEVPAAYIMDGKYFVHTTIFEEMKKIPVAAPQPNADGFFRVGAL